MTWVLSAVGLLWTGDELLAASRRRIEKARSTVSSLTPAGVLVVGRSAKLDAVAPQ